MLPLFTAPLAFAGLAALPALAAIYLLHNRARPYVVSSLLLWSDARRTPEGGRTVERLRTPPLFWLELLALLLLILAAAGPHLPAAPGARPLVVVLDDSFSMQAGGFDSPRKRAAAALLEELRWASRRSVRLVLAGERPQLLGDGATRAAEVAPLLDAWTCQAPAGRLGPAVAFALELGGDLASVLVLTDHPPAPPQDSAGRVRWWAFGVSRPDGTFVNAARSPGPRGERMLLEVANLADSARTVPVRVEAGRPPREVHRADLSLKAGEAERVVLELPAELASQDVRAEIGPDDLPYDDAVTLVPASRKRVGVDNRIADASLRVAVDRALKAVDAVDPLAERPALRFVSGDADAPADETAWTVRLVSESDAEAFTGPFVLDRAHPLTDGLALAGVVWGGGKGPLPGAPVVMAGNVLLVTDVESASGRHEIRLRLRADLSTLTQSPAWPTLVWNLVQWRAANLPGVDRANVRLGDEVTWTLPTAADAVEVVRPGGDAVTVPAGGRRVSVRADRVGVYELRAGEESARFAANPLSRDESDLTKCESGKWGDERDATTLRLEYRDASWMLVLLALGVMTLHLWLAGRARG